MHGGLCRLRLLLAVHVRDERNVNQREVFVANPELELPHGFYEWRRLNVSDRPPELNVTKTFSYNTVAQAIARTSTMHTSGSSPVSSTGIFETRSIQS